MILGVQCAPSDLISIQKVARLLDVGADPGIRGWGLVYVWFDDD